jgi:transposase-like protein
MRIAGEESERSWDELIDGLVRRNVGRPLIAVIDGHAGLETALRRVWPAIDIQRCTNHKLWNLLAKAPTHLREELAEDYRRMIYAENRQAVERARAAFVRKWKLRCQAAVRSLEEAREELFTSLRYPASQWKALRTTDALERIHQELRRRLPAQAGTETQASLPSEDAVLLLLIGLLRTGQVVLRRMVGWPDIPLVLKPLQAALANVDQHRLSLACSRETIFHQLTDTTSL